MTISWIFIFAPSVIIIYLAVWHYLDSKKAARRKRQEAAIDSLFNKWVENPSQESRDEMNNMLEERYGR